MEKLKLSSVAEILAALPAEQRALIEQSLKRGSTGRGFVHVGHTQYYDAETKEGKTVRTNSGIDNPNSLKVSTNERIGRRFRGFSVNRQKDNTLRLTAFSAPCASVTLDKNGMMYIAIKDTFSDAERKFIADWQKTKFTERPANAPEAPAPAEAPSETPSAPAAPSVSESAIKVALIKSKKLKPTAENISLVNDIMSSTGASLDEAVSQLAS